MEEGEGLVSRLASIDRDRDWQRRNFFLVAGSARAALPAQKNIENTRNRFLKHTQHSKAIHFVFSSVSEEEERGEGSMRFTISFNQLFPSQGFSAP